jgi:hypothetical protein
MGRMHAPGKGICTYLKGLFYLFLIRDHSVLRPPLPQVTTVLVEDYLGGSCRPNCQTRPQGPYALSNWCYTP